MTRVPLAGECGLCGHMIRVELPAASDTIHGTDQWVRCAKCGHVNALDKEKTA